MIIHRTIVFCLCLFYSLCIGNEMEMYSNKSTRAALMNFRANSA